MKKDMGKIVNQITRDQKKTTYPWSFPENITRKQETPITRLMIEPTHSLINTSWREKNLPLHLLRHLPNRQIHFHRMLELRKEKKRIEPSRWVFRITLYRSAHYQLYLAISIQFKNNQRNVIIPSILTIWLIYNNTKYCTI